MFKSRYIHGTIILVFFLIPVFSSPDFDGSFRLFTLPPFQRDLFQKFLLLLFFYFHYLYLIPTLYLANKKVLYTFIVIFSFFIICFIPQGLFQSNEMISPHFNREIPPPFRANMMADNSLFRIYISTIFPFLFAGLISVFLWMYKRNQENIAAKTKAELLSLKYQLQPHFLFNTLNSIYSLALNKSKDAPEAVMKLSNIMRYIVSESGKDRILLNVEIDHIKDYIALQLLKADDSIQFYFHLEGEIQEQKIAPLLLITFVENAFKYGYNPENESIVKITIQLEKASLEFNVYNSKSVEKSKMTSMGLGLSSTKTNLESNYKNCYELTIVEDVNSFNVNLKLKLDD